MKPSRKSVIILVLVMSLLLYLAGVFSGLYANKLLEERTQTELNELKSSTQRDIAALEEGTTTQIDHLNSYITFLEQNLQTLQLEQAFLLTLNEEESCKLSRISTEHLVEQLQYYRERLPYRLELYERENEPSEEYLLIKQQYNALSIRTWILLRSQFRTCENAPKRGLYFYSPTCMTCVKQGEALDLVTAELRDQNEDLMLFTVDFDANTPLLKFIKEYYNITAVPAIIIEDEVLQGRLYTDTEILEVLK